jgi:hypothetical protein
MPAEGKSAATSGPGEQSPARLPPVLKTFFFDLDRQEVSMTRRDAADAFFFLAGMFVLVFVYPVLFYGMAG